jgi:hypothetical protein
MWNVLHQASWLLGLDANPIPASLDHSPGAGPYSYVGPIANGGSWTNGFKLASAAVSNMTLEEKVRDEVLCCAMDLLAGTNGVLVGVSTASVITDRRPIGQPDFVHIRTLSLQFRRRTEIRHPRNVFRRRAWVSPSIPIPDIAY